MTSNHKRRLIRNIIVAAILTIALPGCTFLQQQTAGMISNRRGAKLAALPDLSTQPQQKLVSYYGTSFSECMTFKEGLLSATTGLNAGSDYAALILNTLGTIISPLATVHMLTAGAAAAAGLKSTFATDVAADNAVNLTIAFDRIYFQPMAKLAETSLSAALTPDTAPGVLSQIISLQAQCSLDEARAYINQNLTQSSARTASGQLMQPAARAAK